MIFQIVADISPKISTIYLFSNVRINSLQHWLALGRIVSASPGEVPTVIMQKMDVYAAERIRLEAAKLTFGQTEL